MNKALIYTAGAISIGLLLILVPLITSAEIRAENHLFPAGFASLSQQFGTLEGTYGSNRLEYSAAEVEIFAISFVVALAVYFVFKRRHHYEEYRGLAPYPY